MAKYQFTPILNNFKAEHQAASKSPDPKAKKDHDRSVYAAIMKPLQEVKDFYKDYDKLLKEAHLQCKSNMDAIEATLKKSKGKPSPTELRLLKQGQELIENFVAAIDRSGQELRSDMMDWRGSWDSTCGDLVFDRKMLDSIKDYRKQLIDTQAKQWNPQRERVMQYQARVNAIMLAVDRATKDGAKEGKANADELATVKKSHTDCMNAGAKNIRSYIDTVDTELPNWKAEAKNGLNDRDKPNAAKIWAAKEGKIAQFGAYAKGFSGATKTLETLLKAISSGAKGAPDKAAATEWADLKKTIETDIKAIAAAEKQLTELQKYADKVADHFKKAIKG